jgi:hypothetical protein
MLRDGNAANADYVALLDRGGVLIFQWRSTTGGGNGYADGPTVTGPAWLKLVKSGSTYSGYYSTDGVTYTRVGSAQTIRFTNVTYQAGLAITARAASNLAVANFSKLSITPTGTT